MSEQDVVVLTGAASDGIGTALLKRFVADGHRIVGSYEEDDAKSALALGDSDLVTLVEVDHAERSALDSLVAAIPSGAGVKALVNGQFYFAMEDPSDVVLNAWDRSLAVNLTAPLYLFRRLSSRFAESASVVTITSTEAFVGSFGAPAYAATKAAIHNLTMTLANLSGGNGVRVNAVAAGWIGGVMDTDEVFNMSRSITPLGRLGSPDEIANVAAFLLSNESSFINGSVLTVDGGYSGVDTIARYEFESEHSGGDEDVS